MKVGNVVGLVGWRGMVGSVLMDRMQAENDFALIEPVFFSTSNAGGAAPAMATQMASKKKPHQRHQSQAGADRMRRAPIRQKKAGTTQAAKPRTSKSNPLT